MTDDQSSDTPLWAFSLAVYASDGVADECLALQDACGLDVNLLLAAAYLGAVEGMRLDAADIAAMGAAVADWHANIVRPLRQARRALKGKNAEPLRTQVKASELEAEKIEQTVLWHWSRQALAGRSRAVEALKENVRATLAFYGAEGKAVPNLLAAAAGY